MTLNPQDIYDIRSVKWNSPNVQNLYIKGPGLSTKGWERLVFPVGNNDRLERIDLNYCYATNSDMKIFFQGAAKSSSIKDLSPINNFLGVDGVKASLTFL